MISVKFILKAVMWISLQIVPQSAKLNVSLVPNYVKQDLSVKTVSENSCGTWQSEGSGYWIYCCRCENLKQNPETTDT